MYVSVVSPQCEVGSGSSNLIDVALLGNKKIDISHNSPDISILGKISLG